MLIALASDHGGYELKEKIKAHLKDRNIEIRDLGTDSNDSVDYPIYGKKCAESVIKGDADRGIVFCGTGIGISITANKIKGIRCALCTNEFMAEMSRKHNNSNILALGGRVLDYETAKKIVDIWLDTEYEGGRHDRRLALISKIEEEGLKQC